MNQQPNDDGSSHEICTREVQNTGAFHSIIWRPLQRHRGKALVLWVAIVAAGSAYALLLADVYRAEGRLLVRLGRENVLLDPTANLGQGPISAVPAQREGEMYTVVESLRSRQLFESLVDDVTPEAILADQTTRISKLVFWKKPPSFPRDAAVAKAEKMLKIEPLRKSNLVSVSCDAHDLELSERMTAKYIDLCLAHHRSLYRNPTAHEFFDEQVKLLTGKLQATETELLNVKREAGVTKIDEQRRLLLERASQLENELAAADRAASGLQAEKGILENQLKKLPQYVKLQQSDGHPHTATDSMRDQLFTLELREKQLAAELTDEHFRLKQVREQLAEARRIFAEQDRARTQTTEGRNPAFEQVENSLIKLAAEAAATDERRRKIDPQLAEVRGRLDTLNEAEVVIARLERDRELQQADYVKYAASLEQLRIDNALEAERISNISVAQPPSGSSDPIGPDRPLLIGLSIVVATFLSVGMAAVLGGGADQPASAWYAAEADSTAQASYETASSKNGHAAEAAGGHAAESNGHSVEPNGHSVEPNGHSIESNGHSEPNGQPADSSNGHLAPAAS